MAAETPLMIAGSRCELPTIDTFTFDEAQVLYDLAGLTVADFASSDDEAADDAEIAAKLKNPAFVRVLMHVAYQRANPNLSRERVAAVVGKENIIDFLAYLSDQIEEDEAPLALTTKPDGPSLSGLVESSESSGNGSRTSSDALADPLAPIGTTGSDTFSTSGLTSSAA